MACMQVRPILLERNTTLSNKAFGAGANVRACELEEPCSIPCQGFDTADLYHFEAYNEGSP